MQVCVYWLVLVMRMCCWQVRKWWRSEEHTYPHICSRMHMLLQPEERMHACMHATWSAVC
jgi:hypothetical protein